MSPVNSLDGSHLGLVIGPTNGTALTYDVTLASCNYGVTIREKRQTQINGTVKIVRDVSPNSYDIDLTNLKASRTAEVALITMPRF